MPETEEPSDSLSKRRTREKYVDPELLRRNWLQKYIKSDVNFVKSDFANKNYVVYDGSPQKGVDRFIDYVLLW